MIDKQKYAIIVAGGSGKRMGKEVPKQFIVVAGQPILMHTIACFYKYDASINIIVVLPDSQHDYWNTLLQDYNFTIDHTVVSGGEERFYSVKNGLEKVNSESLVAIHDGVRPLVSIDTISNCFDVASEYGNAIPVIAATESIRQKKGEENIAVDRNHYFMVQTPQVFKSELLIKAYQQQYMEQFTDDASVAEKIGASIELVDGNSENIKITRPMDLVIAEALLKDSI